MQTVSEILEEAPCPGHLFPAETVPTTISSAKYDGYWASSGAVAEVVDDDRLAANPINSTDWTGALRGLSMFSKIGELTLLAFVLALVIGCGSRSESQPANKGATTHQSPNTTQMDDASIQTELEQQFQAAMVRGFNPGGPRFDLPQSFYNVFCDHPKIAMNLLEAKLAMPDTWVQVNALDIIGHMLNTPDTHDWAFSKLREATLNQDLPHQNIAQRYLNNQATSRP